MLVGVGVRVGVEVRVGVGVRVGVEVSVDVGVGVLVGVSVAVLVGVGVSVGVGVRVGVSLGVFVGVRVCVTVGVAVGVVVGVRVGVGVSVGVDVRVGVVVGVSVVVRVGVVVGVQVGVGVRVMQRPVEPSQTALGKRSQLPHSPGISGGPHATVPHWQHSWLRDGATARSTREPAKSTASLVRDALRRGAPGKPLNVGVESSTWQDGSLTGNRASDSYPLPSTRAPPITE